MDLQLMLIRRLILFLIRMTHHGEKGTPWHQTSCHGLMGWVSKQFWWALQSWWLRWDPRPKTAQNCRPVFVPCQTATWQHGNTRNATHLKSDKSVTMGKVGANGTTCQLGSLKHGSQNWPLRWEKSSSGRSIATASHLKSRCHLYETQQKHYFPPEVSNILP